MRVILLRCVRGIDQPNGELKSAENAQFGVISIKVQDGSREAYPRDKIAYKNTAVFSPSCLEI